MVVAVSVDVCAVVLLIVTEVGERLHVVGLAAPEGEVVIAQVSATAPVNEFAGVTVMVAALPVVAPGVTEMAPLLVRVKLVLPPGACQKLRSQIANRRKDRPRPEPPPPRTPVPAVRFSLPLRFHSLLSLPPSAIDAFRIPAHELGRIQGPVQRVSLWRRSCPAIGFNPRIGPFVPT